MAIAEEDGGLRSETGSSSINSPRKHSGRSAIIAEVFGEKENVEAEARAVSAAASTTAALSAMVSGNGAAVGATTGACANMAPVMGTKHASAGADAAPRMGTHTRGPCFGRVNEASAVRRIIVGGSSEDLVQHQAALEIASEQSASNSSTPTTSAEESPPKASDDTAAVSDSMGGTFPFAGAAFGVRGVPTTPRPRNGNGRMIGCRAGRGCRRERTTKRFLIKKSRSKAGLAQAPKAFCISSRLAHGTAIGCAAAAAAAASAGLTPRGSPSERLQVTPRSRPSSRMGPVPTLFHARERRLASLAKSSWRKAGISHAASRYTAWDKRDGGDARSTMLAPEFDDEAAPSPVSVEEAMCFSVPTASRPVAGPFSVDLSLPRSVPQLLRPSRCDEETSQKLESEAEWRSAARAGIDSAATNLCVASSRSLRSSTRLSISLQAAEDQDEVLMSPCACAEDEASPTGRGRGDAVSSSVDSAWSMASVDETDREPNAREERVSGDPVARMLLDQSDEVTDARDDHTTSPTFFFGRGSCHAEPKEQEQQEKRSSLEQAVAAAGPPMEWCRTPPAVGMPIAGPLKSRGFGRVSPTPIRPTTRGSVSWTVPPMSAAGPRLLRWATDGPREGLFRPIASSRSGIGSRG